MQKGDTLDAIETPDGLRLTDADPEFEAQMQVARRIMNSAAPCCASWRSDRLAPRDPLAIHDEQLAEQAARPACATRACWRARSPAR